MSAKNSLYERTLKIELGRYFKHERMRKEIPPHVLINDLKIKKSGIGNIDRGRSAYKTMIRACEYLKIDHEGIAQDLKAQMDIDRTRARMNQADFGELAVVMYKVGDEEFKIIGEVMRTVNPYRNVRIIEIKDDGGLYKIKPDFHRIAAHKADVKFYMPT